MLALAYSFGLFLIWGVIGRALVAVFAPRFGVLRAWLVAPGLGLAACLLGLMALNQSGWPIGRIAWPLTGALLAASLGALAWLKPWAGLCAALGCLGCAVSAAWINVWMQKPGSRREFRRRRDAALVATIAELVVGAFWGAAAGLAVAGLVWALVPLALAILSTLALRRSEDAVLRRLAKAATA